MSNRPLSSLKLPNSTLSALTSAGYDTIGDLSSTSPENLAKELHISLSATQALFTASQRPPGPPLSQPASNMVMTRKVFSTACPPVDWLLSGGLKRGDILEISGPPGTVKDVLAVNVAKSFIEAGEGVIFVDMQNSLSPATLFRILCSSSPHSEKLIHHLNIHVVADFMLFMHNLPVYLDANPETSLLVINSISIAFQSLGPAERTHLLDAIKRTLTLLCTSRNLSVVVTSQMATKILNADGSNGTFDTGSKAVLVPYLGPSYLPSGRAHRLVLVPSSPASGVVRVLSTPSCQPGVGKKMPEECYEIEDGQMVGVREK